MTPWAKQYKTDVEAHLSVLLGQPVSIQTMETGWYWFEPVIKLNQVAVGNKNDDVIQLNKLLVGINILGSLWHWQIQPGVLYVDGLNLTIHQNDGHWQIEGLPVNNKASMALSNESYPPVLAWILNQKKIIITHLSTQIYLKDGTLIPLKQFNLRVVNRSGHYRVKGKAILDQSPETDFKLLAEMDLNPFKLAKASGSVYVAANNVQIKQWQNFLNQSRFKLTDGAGDAKLWVDWHAGKITKAQSKVTIANLGWYDELTKKQQLTQQLNANLAWLKTENGWQLSGDKIHLKLAGIKWPENNFLMQYNRNTESFTVYVNQLILESLIGSVPSWPQTLSPILAVLPHGKLTDTQLTFKKGQVDYLLTRFTNLGWQSQDNIPAVSNLSGVVYWQPTQGRLELDSEKTLIKAKGVPDVNFTAINGAVNWNRVESGLQINMERLFVENPDLLLSAIGTIKGITADSTGQVDLSAQLSANHAQRLLQYLPANHLKKKLDAWLKNDIKKIDNLAANINVHGLAADFPYDKQPGEFIIKGYVRGVDVVLAPQWPLTRGVEAFLHVNKRDLDINIVHANLNGNEVDNANVRINDIGYDHETLLMHTKIKANLAKAQSYILASPLNKKLSALKMLSMHGPFNLDLQLEAPLYPENDDILALGDIIFENNNVLVKHSLDDVQLTNLHGSLQFDQEGILDSSLKTNIMGYPANILIKTFREPQSYTEVKIKAQTTIDVLRNKFDLPVFAYMEGSLWLQSLLILTDEPSDLDHLNIQTSLQGVAINLPFPFDKKAVDKAPLTVDIDFNPDKAMRIHSNYDKRISSDLWFSGSKGNFKLEKGEIRLGSEDALWKNQKGLQVVGVLPDFNLKKWQDTLEKIPLASNSRISDSIDFIDVMLKNAEISNQTYKNLSIKALKLPHEEWLIDLNQQDIEAKLHYEIPKNRISGTVTRLYLQKNPEQKNTKEALSKLKAQNMPNLDIKIQDLKYDDLDLGDALIKTTSLAKAWQLDSLQIGTPSYLLSAKGRWSQENGLNETHITADLQIKDLANSLERFHISPVVEAKKGMILFEGKWPGAYQDFSLAKLSGQMAITLRNGRITNLSPETEEKLGLGKLLSVLSLQTIPRRLKLDFSDLSNDGYSFDMFKGGFFVKNGLMTTQDSYIDGPIAYASMKGNLDIAKRLYNVDLRISPHITASLPIVATIAGGPIAGLATWVASKIISTGMQQISGYTYKISGPWKKPVVQQVSIIKTKKEEHMKG